MKKTLLFTLLVCIFISLVGCGKVSSVSNNNEFTQDKAIHIVIKDHSEFPSNNVDTLIKKLPTGGPSGTNADVKFTTNIEKSSGNAYTVTLTKDWGITVNGKYVKSFWKYKVTPDNIVLLDKSDNDYLPGTIK